MKTHNISVKKTARYYTEGVLNDETEAIIFLLHGYGQSAISMMKSCSGLKSAKRFLIAPEGLSRFYWEQFSGKVVASWMTSEDRETEISDYKNYLNSLYDMCKQRSESRESGSESRELRSENRELRSENRESRSENRESGSENRESRSENRESGSESRESGSESRESRSESRESGSENRESGSESRESGSENRESGSESRESGSENRESGSESRESGAAPDAKMICLGFSQGVATGTRWLSHNERKFDMIISIAGAPAKEIDWNDPQDQLKSIPHLYLVGNNDRWIDQKSIELIRSKFDESGLNYKIEIFDGDHSITEEATDIILANL